MAGGYENPLLRLPAGRALAELPDTPEKRAVIDLLLALRRQSDIEAENAWRRRKGPMAAYWRACSTYALHTARALKRKPAVWVVGEL